MKVPDGNVFDGGGGVLVGEDVGERIGSADDCGHFLHEGIGRGVRIVMAGHGSGQKRREFPFAGEDAGDFGVGEMERFFLGG